MGLLDCCEPEHLSHYIQRNAHMLLYELERVAS